MKEQLKQMEVTIHELLVTDAELPNMDELLAQISELLLEHRKFTQEVLRVTLTISTGVTIPQPVHHLPSTTPSFHG